MALSARAALAFVISIAAACGGGSAGDPDAPPPTPDAPPPTPDAPPAIACNAADPAISLAEIPGVVAVDEVSCGGGLAVAATCFAIEFDQPVQHAAPSGPHFTQHLLLAHRGCDAPSLVADWGYSSFGFFDDELSVLYETNSLWIEHRFQGDSTPAPADWDWTSLTIENGANDMHAIITGFRRHYGGRWVSTGASKGGITASYHKYFFPDDLDGSVPYVAPASRARVDELYQDYLDTAFPQPCAQRLRDVQTAALTSRRPMMLQRLTPLVGSGFESAYLELYTQSIDWGFWQAYGVSFCSTVPTAAATDDQFWQFWADFTGFSGASPGPGGDMTYGALYYEWLTEQGFARQVNGDVEPLLTEPIALQSMADYFVEGFPGVALPAHDATVTLATRAWVRDTAEDMVLIYGEYDPWSGGAMETPVHATSGRFFVPQATHGAAISALPSIEEDAALALITPMFGRPPSAAKPAARQAAAARGALIAEHQRRVMADMLRLRLRGH
jgi:hypothetical protein